MGATGFFRPAGDDEGNAGNDAHGIADRDADGNASTFHHYANHGDDPANPDTHGGNWIEKGPRAPVSP